jgi:hypothetical protein
MTKKLTIDILAKDKTKQALTGVQKNLNNVKNTVFSLKGALVGLGAGAIVKSFVDVGKEVESLQVRFKFLFGSVEEGAIAFDNLTTFAGKVPFSLEEISRASGNLAVVAKDAEDLNRVLEITGNVAAVTGLDFETTSSQIQRAFSGGIGAADLFRERGVRALLGFQAGAKVTAEETIARFEELFSGDGQFARATADLATTLEGTLSMIGDKYFKFQKDVAAGFFDELKKEFGDLNKFLEDNEQQIKDIANSIGENLAKALTSASEGAKALAPSFKTIGETGAGLISGFMSLPDYVKSVGIVGALIGGRLGFGVLVSISAIAKAFKDITEATKPENIKLDELRKDLKDVNDEIERLEFSTDISDIKRLEGLKVERDVLEELIEARKKIINATINELIPSIEKTRKEISEQDKEIIKINNSMELASQQAEAFGGAFFDAAVKAKKELEIVNEETFPSFKKALEDAGNTTLQLDNLFTNTFNGFADTLADSLMTGKFAFKDFARSVIRDIARIIARQQALLILQRASGFLGNVFGISLPIPAPRSSGGRVNAGMPYITGEAGKELFIPQTSGTIVPNNQLAGAGATNINFTINTVDAQGVDELLTNRRSTIINVINDALNRQGKEALV